MDRMPSSYYRERAAESAHAAANAKLANVRERSLRSEAAWLEMAARQDETDALKLDFGDDDDEDEGENAPPS